MCSFQLNVCSGIEMMSKKKKKKESFFFFAHMVYIWILRHVDFSLNVAPESSGTWDHQERSGPGLPESSEGLWSWGTRCCSQQSQRSVHEYIFISWLIKTLMQERDLLKRWIAWLKLNNLFQLLVQSVPYFIDGVLFFRFLLEFCENLPEDSREQIIMTHILPCVKVKNKPSCLPHCDISLVLHFSVEQKMLWFAMSC